jgi:hypothetical protein
MRGGTTRRVCGPFIGLVSLGQVEVKSKFHSTQALIPCHSRSLALACRTRQGRETTEQMRHGACASDSARQPGEPFPKLRAGCSSHPGGTNYNENLDARSSLLGRVVLQGCCIPLRSARLNISGQSLDVMAISAGDEVAVEIHCHLDGRVPELATDVRDGHATGAPSSWRTYGGHRGRGRVAPSPSPAKDATHGPGATRYSLDAQSQSRMGTPTLKVIRPRRLPPDTFVVKCRREIATRLLAVAERFCSDVVPEIRAAIEQEKQ